MLDVSFSELVVCLLVALVVLGPEKLPGAARAVGRWTGKARAYMRTFTAELEREAQLSDIRKQLEETQRILREQSVSLERSAQGLVDQAKSLPPPEHLAHPPTEAQTETAAVPPPVSTPTSDESSAPKS